MKCLSDSFDGDGLINQNRTFHVLRKSGHFTCYEHRKPATPTLDWQSEFRILKSLIWQPPYRWPFPARLLHFFSRIRRGSYKHFSSWSSRC